MPSLTPEQIGCGTALVYRNIIFRDCETKEFSQVAVPDASGTDILMQKFRISIVSHVHEEDHLTLGLDTKSAGVSGLGASPNPQEMVKRMHAWLMHPRGDLQYYNEGQLVIEARGPDTLVDGSGNPRPIADDYTETQFYDAANGPKPMSCNIVHVAGFKSYQVSFTIEFSLTLCDQDLRNAGSTSNPNYPAGSTRTSNLEVLSNRWTSTETRNADFMLTRVFSGTLVVRSYGTFAHTFRNLCLPTLGRGYQRQRMTFVQSPDGLSLQYTITDQQRYAAPPRPAIDWRGTHTESVNKFGQYGQSTISIWLKGALGTPKKQLLNAAIATVRHRIGDLRNAAQIAEDTTIIPESMTLIDTLQECEIQLNVTVKRTPGRLNRWANIYFDVLGKLPAVNANTEPQTGFEAGRNDQERDDAFRSQYERDSWLKPLAYDSSTPAGMFATYLQSPCIPFHGTPQLERKPVLNSNLAESDYNDEPADDPEIAVYEGESAAIPPSPDSEDDQQLSQEHLDFHYTHFEIDSTYVTDRGIQALPLAKKSETGQAMVCVARVSNPITYRDVWIKAKRVGERPATPMALEQLTDSNGIEETLIYDSVVPSAPILLANGQQYEYGIEAHYRYVLNRTPTADEKLRAGSLPWDVTEKADNEVVIASTHQEDII